MAFLGRATGQRIFDMFKKRPVDLTEDGIHLPIGKLRGKPHFVPLAAAQMIEIRSWGVRDLDFFIATPVTGKRGTECPNGRHFNRRALINIAKFSSDPQAFL